MNCGADSARRTIRVWLSSATTRRNWERRQIGGISKTRAVCTSDILLTCLAGGYLTLRPSCPIGHWRSGHLRQHRQVVGWSTTANLRSTDGSHLSCRLRNPEATPGHAADRASGGTGHRAFRAFRAVRTDARQGRASCAAAWTGSSSCSAAATVSGSSAHDQHPRPAGHLSRGQGSHRAADLIAGYGLTSAPGPAGVSVCCCLRPPLGLPGPRHGAGSVSLVFPW
jgi:hypothetical protein